MKKFLFLPVLFLCWHTAFGQLTMGLQLNFQPDPDPREWPNQTGLLVVTTLNAADQTFQFRYKGRMTLNGETVMDNDINKMPIETIGPFDTEIREVQDLLPPAALNVYGDIKDTYVRTSQFPAGYYLVCAQAFDLQGNALSPEACAPMLISSYQQPALIFPPDGMTLPAGAPPTFSWTPVTPPPPFPVTYRLRAVEVPADVSTSDAPEDDFFVAYPRLESEGWSAGEPLGGIWGRENENGEPDPLQRKVLNTNWNSCRSQRDNKRAPEDDNGDNRTKEQPGGGSDPTPQKVLNTNWNSCRSQRDNIMAPSGRGNHNRPVQAGGGSPGNRTAVPGGSTGALQAFQYGFPLIDIELPDQTQTIWPPDVQGPEPGRQYVWSVQALREDGRPIGGNNGMAQPFGFGVANLSPPEDEELEDFAVPEAIVLIGGCYHHLYTDGTWVVGECPPQPGGPTSAPSRLEVAANRNVFAEGNNAPILRLADGKELEELVQSRFALANRIGGGNNLIVAPQGGQGGGGEPQGVNGSIKVGSLIIDKKAAGNAGNGGDNTPTRDGRWGPPVSSVIMVLKNETQTLCVLEDGTVRECADYVAKAFKPGDFEPDAGIKWYICYNGQEAQKVMSCHSCKGQCSILDQKNIKQNRTHTGAQSGSGDKLPPIGDPIPGIDIALEQPDPRKGGIKAPGSGQGSGEGTLQLDGDPIPGIDVALEQIPGGIKPPDSGNNGPEGYIAVFTCGPCAIGMKSDGTWTEVLIGPSGTKMLDVKRISRQGGRDVVQIKPSGGSGDATPTFKCGMIGGEELGEVASCDECFAMGGNECTGKYIPEKMQPSNSGMNRVKHNGTMDWCQANDGYVVGPGGCYNCAGDGCITVELSVPMTEDEIRKVLLGMKKRNNPKRDVLTLYHRGELVLFKKTDGTFQDMTEQYKAGVFPMGGGPANLTYCLTSNGSLRSTSSCGDCFAGESCMLYKSVIMDALPKAETGKPGKVEELIIPKEKGEIGKGKNNVVPALQLYNQGGRIKYQQEDGTYLDVTTFYDAGNLTSRSPKEVTVCKDSAGNWAEVKSDCEACPAGTASCTTFTIGVNPLKILRNLMGNGGIHHCLCFYRK